MSEQLSPRLYASELMNPSVEHLAAAFVGYQRTLGFFQQRYTDPENVQRLSACEQKLREAEMALFPVGTFSRRKIFLAWSLLHQICEDFFLFLNREELIAEGTQLIANLALAPIPDGPRKEWTDKLKAELCELEKPDANLNRARNLFKMAMVTLNSHVDSRFWDLWSGKLSALIYTVLLIVGFALLLLNFYTYDSLEPSLEGVFLLGAMGGVASGILTTEPQYLAKGHFWVSTLYYSLVRPAQGALAALVMFWLIQSHYLISIEERGDTATTTAFSNQSTAGKGKATPAAGKSDGSLIVFRTSDEGRPYLLLLMLLLAGFSGDKLLKSVSDKVMARLFFEAEKTKEAQKPEAGKP